MEKDIENKKQEIIEALNHIEKGNEETIFEYMFKITTNLQEIVHIVQNNKIEKDKDILFINLKEFSDYLLNFWNNKDKKVEYIKTLKSMITTE